MRIIKNLMRSMIRRSLPAQLRWVHGRRFALSSEEWAQVHFSFSQYGEDLLVWELLRREGRTHAGFYVDVGAFDPILYSNTNLLYQRGWQGLNLDLSDEAILRFNQVRARDINVQCAVSDAEREMILCKYPIAATNRLLPVEVIDRKSILGEEPVATTTIKALPLAKVLDTYLPSEARLDFMDVDCEGHDLAVLKSNNWSKYRPFILAVEDVTNDPESEAVRYCTAQGYDLAATLFITRIFLDQGASAEAKAAWRMHATNGH